MINKEQYEVIIAAVLHDIGKFKQRAFGGKEDDLSDEAKTIEAQILPKTQYETYSHRHAIWTFDFFQKDLLPLLNNPKVKTPDLDWNLIRNISSEHHNPTSELGKIITEADRISASIDRDKVRDSFARGEYLKTKLRSPFNLVSLGNEYEDLNMAYNLSEYSINSLFPRKDINKIDLTNDYFALWQNFTNDLVKTFNTTNYDLFVNNLYSLLEKYTITIPSATNDYYHDISLYDHSITTAVFALNLYLRKDNKNENEFLYCSTDLSGIQNFIFQNPLESFRGNSKVIRGRSFYLTVLAEAFFLKISEELKIAPFFRLINAGGNMTFILPNLDIYKNKMIEVEEECDKWIFKHTNAELAILCDYSLEISKTDLRKDNFPKLLLNAHNSLEKKKNKKFERVLKIKDAYILNFNLNDNELCDSCGKETSIERNSGKNFCKKCYQYYEIGNELVKQKFIEFTFSQKGKYQLFNSVGLTLRKVDDFIGSEKFVYSLVGDLEYPKWTLNNYVAKDEEGLLSFEEIAEQALENEGETGSEFLAFIKIDIDNLGFTFTDGFRHLEDGKYNNKISVSRFVSVSRLISFFFNTFLYSFLERKYNDFYTVLSGGDDLFVIGPWNKSLNFIRDLNSEFKKFVGGNKDLNFSAGIEINKARNPINKSSNKAEDYLDKAKEIKNSFVLFDSDPISFSKQDELLELINWLQNKIDDEESGFSTNFLYRLLHYVRMAKDFKNNRDIKKLSYISDFLYDLTRNIYNNKNIEEVGEIKEKFESYAKENPDFFEVALKYVIYNNRKN